MHLVVKIVRIQCSRFQYNTLIIVEDVKYCKVGYFFQTLFTYWPGIYKHSLPTEFVDGVSQDLNFCCSEVLSGKPREACLSLVLLSVPSMLRYIPFTTDDIINCYAVSLVDVS